MNIKGLIEKLNGLVPDDLKLHTPVAVEKQQDLGQVGTKFDHFAISGLDSESCPGTVELLALFPNAPHTNVGVLLSKLNEFGEEIPVNAKVGSGGEKLEITDVISYSGLYVIIRGE